MSKSRKIPSNLILQNCFIRDTVNLSDVDCFVSKQKDTFLSIDEVLSDDGVKIVSTVNDYPITPEYVNSFVESSDYHNDIQGAVLNSRPRQNLGDITGFQDVASMDMESARMLYSQLSERLGKNSDVVNSNVASSVSNSDSTLNNSGEVNGNG